MAQDAQRMRWTWVHGVAIFAGIQVATFGFAWVVQQITGRRNVTLGGTVGNDADDNAFYNEQRQPVFAPPDWSFAPVWAVNNTLVVWGLLRVLNKPDGTPRRARYVGLQGVSLALYSAFSGLYFGLQSPVNGALLTDVNVLVIGEALRVALSLVTLVPWLLLAAPVATLVALWNRDNFFRAGPFLTPPAGWVKGGKRG